MTGFVRTIVSLYRKCFTQYVVVHPRQDLETRLSLKPLTKEQQKGVRKEEDEQHCQGEDKQGDVSAMKVPDVTVNQPHSFLRSIGILQERCIECCYYTAEKFCTGEKR